MIAAKLSEYSRYFKNELLHRTCEFLLGLSADTADGIYPLIDDAVRVIVSSYQTRPARSGRPEAHRDFIDIQMVLAGSEVIACWPVADLQVAEAYDHAQDVEWFLRPDPATTRIVLTPGTFALFLPGDAHQPQIMRGRRPAAVKKAVAKIAVKSVSVPGW